MIQIPLAESGTESREHVLDAAERLFLERGYAGTRLRDLADALGIKPASLYHHAPGGKKELWQRVMDRSFDRHHANLRTAAEQAGDDLRGQLVAMADWLLSQPPMNVVALAASDVLTASQPDAHDVSERIYEGIMVPVRDAFQSARDRGEIGDASADLLAGMFVASVNGLVPSEHAGSLPHSAQVLATAAIDVLLDGARPRT